MHDLVSLQVGLVFGEIVSLTDCYYFYGITRPTKPLRRAEASQKDKELYLRSRTSYRQWLQLKCL